MATSEEANGSVPLNNSSEKKIPEWILAREGINLILNDRTAEAEKLFLKYPDSLVMYAGYAFVLLMDALMSFEEDRLLKAMTALKEVERRCVTETGWLKTVTNKVFGTATSIPQKSYSTELETQIILADSQVCIAILTFLQHDFTGYFKGAWVLRKAWKIYQKVYNEIMDLYKDNVGDLNLPEFENNVDLVLEEQEDTINNSDIDWDLAAIDSNGYIQNSSIPHSKSSNLQQLNRPESFSPSKSCKSQSLIKDLTNMFSLKKSISINGALSGRVKENFLGTRQNSISKSVTFYNISSSIFPPSNVTQNKPLEKHVIIRLMGAVSFGYGLFQLGVSLLPPSLIRLINIFGFSTNRDHGITCLMYARLGLDMRAPLATLSLLWYHTIVRPFYAIDGSNIQAGVEAAFMLLKESSKDYGNSSLFLFFQGRANRVCSNIKKALESFQAAACKAQQREMKILCMHEIGWCHLIELEYSSAMNSFLYLKSTSRWSKAFYAYLAAICSGACGDTVSCQVFDNLKDMTADVPKGIQLDVFLIRRTNCCPSDLESVKRKDMIYWKLLVFEMLYLWNALPSCSDENVQLIIDECIKVSVPEDEPMLGLSKLILGCSYCVQKQYDRGIATLRKCLELRKNIPSNANDAHISAFCQYELAALLVKNGETKPEGILLLQQMSQYHQYDFEQKLNVRVHALLKQ